MMRNAYRVWEIAIFRIFYMLTLLTKKLKANKSFYDVFILKYEYFGLIEYERLFKYKTNTVQQWLVLQPMEYLWC
jgi:hypothetical protein